jgi:hypothetical protein
VSWFWFLDKQLREVRATPHFTIAALPEVTVGRLVGLASPLDGKTIEAPFTGAPCLAYFAKIRGTARVEMIGGQIGFPGGSHDPGDSDLVVDNGGVPFVLEDLTGSATIDTDNAICALDVDFEKYKVTSKLTPRQRAYAERARVMDVGVLHFYEAIVAPGEKIAVVGFGQRVDGHLRMSSSPHLRLVICDNTATTG